ncbi:diacylglycerol kinase family protein [Butyrivibrio sp. AE3004]|uniref:diacylglycerol kinase family protein n=1 Tax=Butyrivibrio sp. AE3004 TaxID=1506994 RepID=UPI00049447BD|nr:diacylglycerol kinase family protein [Butyrivibrio sp. AE3004]
MDNKKPKKIKLYKSFGYAFEGIFNTILHERNMQIHCAVTVLVVIFGIILKISLLEWFFCIILFALVMSLELVNTSIEAVVDLVTEERKPLAKKAKDAAAGAVLISAIFAAVMGGIIFFPKLWNLFL